MTSANEEVNFQSSWLPVGKYLLRFNNKDSETWSVDVSVVTLLLTVSSMPAGKMF